MNFTQNWFLFRIRGIPSTTFRFPHLHQPTPWGTRVVECNWHDREIINNENMTSPLTQFETLLCSILSNFIGRVNDSICLRLCWCEQQPATSEMQIPGAWKRLAELKRYRRCVLHCRSLQSTSCTNAFREFLQSPAKHRWLFSDASLPQFERRQASDLRLTPAKLALPTRSHKAGSISNLLID